MNAFRDDERKLLVEIKSRGPFDCEALFGTSKSCLLDSKSADWRRELELESAMDALCRAIGAEADPGRALPAATIAEENGRGRRASAQVRTAA